MKPPMPIPMIASASITLTAAMMPSSRLVVPSSPAMTVTSEGSCLSAGISVWTRARLAERVVQQPPPFVGNTGGSLERAAEAVELSSEIVERRFELAPERTAALGEKQVAGHSADTCPDERRRDSCLISHACLPDCRVIPGHLVMELQVMCHTCSRDPRGFTRLSAEIARAHVAFHDSEPEKCQLG